MPSSLQSIEVKSPYDLALIDILELDSEKRVFEILDRSHKLFLDKLSGYLNTSVFKY